MKWLYGIGGLLLAMWLSPFGILWKDVGTWRFRTVLAVETPEGARESSSVLETRQWLFRDIQGGGMSLGTSLRGEAVFLDLPGGRNLVMLLDKQEIALDTLLMGKRRPDGQLENAVPSGAKAEVPEHLIPTLVTFRDLNNPASAQEIRPQGLEAFGPGYRLKEVRLEMVSAGLWPFNLLPIPFPQALFGTRITTGIEKRIAFWSRRGGMTWEQMRKPDGFPLSDEDRTRLSNIFSGIKKDM